MLRPVKVAAVQAEPGWNNLQASVDKTISLIQVAGKRGANVLGFPEVFIPGYPTCIWHCSPLGNAQFIREYVNNSLVKESPEMSKIRNAVKAAGLFVVLGYSEKDRGSIYISQVCHESVRFSFSVQQNFHKAYGEPCAVIHRPCW